MHNAPTLEGNLGFGHNAQILDTKVDWIGLHNALEEQAHIYLAQVQELEIEESNERESTRK